MRAVDRTIARRLVRRSQFVFQKFKTIISRELGNGIAITGKWSLLAQTHRNTYTSEQSASYQRPQEDLVEDIIAALYDECTNSRTLQQRLESIVHKAGWWDEAIAKNVLYSLEYALQSSTVRQVCNRAYEEAKTMEELASDHPDCPFVPDLPQVPSPLVGNRSILMF